MNLGSIAFRQRLGIWYLRMDLPQQFLVAVAFEERKMLFLDADAKFAPTASCFSHQAHRHRIKHLVSEHNSRKCLRQAFKPDNLRKTTQYEALLATENIKLVFADDGIKRLAEISFSVNERTENIGARRLYTVMEKLLEEISFTATETGSTTIVIDTAYVNDRLEALAINEDLSRYVL